MHECLAPVKKTTKCSTRPSRRVQTWKCRPNTIWLRFQLIWTKCLEHTANVVPPTTLCIRRLHGRLACIFGGQHWIDEVICWPIFFTCVFVCVFFVFLMCFCWCLQAQFFLTSLIYRWLITYGKVRTHEMCWDTCMLIEISPEAKQTKLFAKLMNFRSDLSLLRVKTQFIHSTSANLLRSYTNTSTRTNAKLFEFGNQQWWP